MNYKVLLLLGISSGLVGAAVGECKQPIGKSGIQFCLRSSGLARWYTARHGVFFDKAGDHLPQLISLSTLQGRPVPETVTLSPRGSFWYAALIDDKNRCLWIDAVNKVEGEAKVKGQQAARRSIELPVGCDPSSDIFWSSDDATLGIFNRHDQSIDLYAMNQAHTTYCRFEETDFDSDVQVMTYDPTTLSIAAICNPRFCTKYEKCGDFDCKPGHRRIATLSRLVLPAGKQEHVFSSKELLTYTHECRVDYGDFPLLQFSNDGKYLLYTFNSSGSLRKGYVFAKQGTGWRTLNVLEAEQLCFAEDTRFILLYVQSPDEPTKAKIVTLDSHTNKMVASEEIGNLRSVALHAEGVIGITGEGLIKSFRIIGREAKEEKPAEEKPKES